MNPNQPNHNPANFTRPLTASRRIAKWGGTRMFSRPAKDAFDAARKLYRQSRKIGRAKYLDQLLGAAIPETSAGSDLDISAVDATIHQNMSQGLNGATIDGHLRMVCNYANEWHQRMDPDRNYTGVGVSKSARVTRCIGRSVTHWHLHRLGEYDCKASSCPDCTPSD